MPSSPPAVRAQDLTVVRGTRTVLDGLGFTVPRGQITGLLGPSGCGKSTLMRATVGTQARVGGTLEVLCLPAGDAALRSRVGYVTQAPSVYDDLTVRQNLDYFAAILDPGRTAAERRHADVTRVIADVDLASHANSLAGNLSGGQRSRVSLAVALLGTPELLVLDEPTVGLDPVLRRDLWSLFHAIAEERDATLLISSHVMDEAERCHRLLLMREGGILADDTPDALRERTGSDTVEAAFLHLVDEAVAAAHRSDSAPGPTTPRQTRTILDPGPPTTDHRTAATTPRASDDTPLASAAVLATPGTEPLTVDAESGSGSESGAESGLESESGPAAHGHPRSAGAHPREDRTMSPTAPTSPTPATAPAGPGAASGPARPASRPSALNAARTTATATRVLRQLRHDPRTIALMIVIPCVMLLLLRYVFDGNPHTFDSIGASLLGIFPLITMFLVTSIATLRERTSGTLERLLAMPLGKGDLIAGYALAFGALAVVQSALATGLAVWFLGLDVTGSPWLLLLVALLDALLGTALGLFVSAFAASEFQAVQFMPAVIFPQLLLCGLFTARSDMHPVLEAISDVLPMSYAVDGMNEVLRHTDMTATFVRDALIVAGTAVLVLGLGAATLRRRTP